MTKKTRQNTKERNRRTHTRQQKQRHLERKGVEKMKGEICSIHGDVCECSEDTKMEGWILQGTVRFIMENSTVCDPEDADFVVHKTLSSH